MSDSANADEPYRIVWSAPARRRLDRLPEGVIGALVDLTYGPIADNPRRLGHPLEFDFEGLWSARSGPYRVIYEIDERERIVKVVMVGHRRDVYRSR